MPSIMLLVGVGELLCQAAAGGATELVAADRAMDAGLRRHRPACLRLAVRDQGLGRDCCSRLEPVTDFGDRQAR